MRGARLRARRGEQVRSPCRGGRATMPMNAVYQNPGDLAAVIPGFPLPGALLLPRGPMPLTIFEPRYAAMIDDALRAGHRLIGMIHPDPSHPGPQYKPTPNPTPRRPVTGSSASAASPSAPSPARAATPSSSPALPAFTSTKSSPYRRPIDNAA